MSNSAIAPSVSLVSPSVSRIEDYDYLAAVRRVAERKLGSNGLTTSSHTLNRSKLVSSVCADLRSHYPQLFDKRDAQGNIIPESVRLPEEYFNKVVNAVDSFIDASFESFKSNADQLVKVSTRYVHKAKQRDVVLRHTIQRDEIVSLQSKKMGITLFIGETKRQIDKINAQSAVLSEVTMERLKKLESRLIKENETLNAINQQMAQMKSLTPPASGQ